LFCAARSDAHEDAGLPAGGLPDAVVAEAALELVVLPEAGMAIGGPFQYVVMGSTVEVVEKTMSRRGWPMASSNSVSMSDSWISGEEKVASEDARTCARAEGEREWPLAVSRTPVAAGVAEAVEDAFVPVALAPAAAVFAVAPVCRIDLCPGCTMLVSICAKFPRNSMASPASTLLSSSQLVSSLFLQRPVE